MSLSQSAELLQAKSELAEQYLEGFKKDLGLLQKGVVTLVEKRLKTYLLQDKELPSSIADFTLTRWEKFLVSLSPKMAEKVFQFLKEKQTLLLKVKTVEELNNLKNGILSNPTDQSNSVMNDDNNNEGNNENNQQNTDNQTSGDNTEGSTASSAATSGQDFHKSKTSSDGQQDHGSEGIGDLVAIGAGGALEVGQKIYNDGLKWTKFEGVNGAKAEKLAQELNVADVKKLFTNTKNVLETRVNDARLLPKQRKEIKKAYDAFVDASKHADAFKELKAWKSLVKSNVLTNNIFDVLHITEETAGYLQKIAQDAKLMEQIAKLKDVQKIKTLLQNKGITGLSDDLIAILQKSSTLDEVKDVVSVLSKQKELTSLAKAARIAPFLDVIMFGMEVKNFWGQEKNVRNISHFFVNGTIYGGTAVWSVGAMMGLFASGPTGWVVMGGVVAAEGINYAMDACYFDVRDFYEQKKDDFIKQSRTELKQAIIQATKGASGNSLSINEHIYNTIPGGPGREQKITTVENAMWGMIYTDEVLMNPIFAPVAAVDQNNSYATLSPEQKQEYDSKKKQLDAIIEQRMMYMKLFLTGGEKALQFTNAIRQSRAVEFVEKIVADSKIHAEMVASGVQGKTIDEYKNYVEGELQKQNPILFEKITTFIKKNPSQVPDFFAGIVACASETWHTDDPTHEEYADDIVMKPIVDYAQSYMHWYTMGKPYEQQKDLDAVHQDVDMVQMHQLLKDMSNGKDVTMKVTQETEFDMKRKLVTEIEHVDRFNDVLEYATDIRQNIIYRIAKEFHGYHGGNSMKELKAYFAENNKDKKKGLYYEESGLDNNDGRRMNVDRWGDAELNFFKIEEKSPEQLMKDWFDVVVGPNGNIGMLNTNTGIDGETESADNTINKEFFKKIYMILKEEKEAHSEQNKQAVTKEVQEYIKKNATNGYIKIPISMVNKIARAGLGNALYRYFTNEGGNIVGVTTNEFLTIPLLVGGIEKRYVENKDGSDKTLTTEEINQLPIKKTTATEQKTIAGVEKATNTILLTIGKLSWSDQRGAVQYDVMTKKLTSRGSETMIEEKNGKFVVAGGELAIEYTNVQEAIYVANMINRLRKYKLEHQDVELEYFNGITGNFGRPKGLYDVNTGFWGTDTRLISQSEIKSKFDYTFSGDNYKTFIDYIEKKLQ